MTKTKICGLRTLEDVDLVNLVAPDYAGFVFAKSKRQVNDTEASRMRERLNKEIQSVGVFVNDSISHIVSLCSSKVIDLVQLHGEESEEYIRKLKEQIQVPIIKAVRLSSKEAGNAALKTMADYLLFDAFVETSIYGGSGTFINTSFLPVLERPAFVAGGLTSENVEMVIREHHPFCVDVSSSVETEGKKDYEKMRQFIAAVKTSGGN